MKIYTKEELKEILRLHKLYLNLGEGGVCADLRNANLIDANLLGANLRGAIGNMSEIKSMQIDVYSIAYTFYEMQIGCQKHTIDRWKGFTDEEIEGMDGDKALRFWKKYKDFIFMAIELSTATKTKEEI